MPLPTPVNSLLSGPAKVYTMRGRFRQFFMRVDQFDQLQAQSAHIGVSKERTLSVFVEAVSALEKTLETRVISSVSPCRKATCHVLPFSPRTCDLPTIPVLSTMPCPRSVHRRPDPRTRFRRVRTK